MIRCPRCDRLVVDTERVQRCPGCGASLVHLEEDFAALRRSAWQLWWQHRLTGPAARRAVGLGAVVGAVAAVLTTWLGVAGTSHLLIAAIAGAGLGGLVGFLRLGHLSGMLLYGLGMMVVVPTLNFFVWIPWLTTGAVIAFACRDQREGR